MQTTNSTARAGSSFNLQTLEESIPGKAVLCVAASVFVALCAHVSVPLPFTPVPLTLSNFAVILVGLALAPATAFSAMLLYLVEGAMGFPVFTSGGPAGMMHLLGPTGGFLFAYPWAAAVTSALHRALSISYLRRAASLIACSAATLLIFLLGTGWLATLLHLAPSSAFRLGVLPFLPGEVIKIAAATGIFASLKRWQRS